MAAFTSRCIFGDNTERRGIVNNAGIRSIPAGMPMTMNVRLATWDKQFVCFYNVQSTHFI